MQLQIFNLLTLLVLVVTVSAEDLYQYNGGYRPRWASFENPGAKKGAAALSNFGAKGHAFDCLKAGESVVLMNHVGSGIIRRIWITVSDRSPEMLRSLTLSMFWDGADRPAVLAPLSDFFCVSHGRMCAFENALFSDPEGRSFTCVIPMPFRRSARVVLTNDSSKELSHLFYDVDFEIAKSLPRDSLYFHCYWNRVPRTHLGLDYLILPEIKGRGRFLGVNLGIIANKDYDDSWWGEGEVKMYLDEDTAHPTLAGTGTEDYAGTGWGLGIFAHSNQGCLLADSKTNRMWSFYRLHIPDPVFFHSSAKVTIQAIGGTGPAKIRELLRRGVSLKPVSVDVDGKFIRLLESNAPQIDNPNFPEGWVNFFREDDYCSTAYFYLDKPSNQLPPLPPLAIRTAQLK